MYSQAGLNNPERPEKMKHLFHLFPNCPRLTQPPKVTAKKASKAAPIPAPANNNDDDDAAIAARIPGPANDDDDEYESTFNYDFELDEGELFDASAVLTELIEWLDTHDNPLPGHSPTMPPANTTGVVGLAAVLHTLFSWQSLTKSISTKITQVAVASLMETFIVPRYRPQLLTTQSWSNIRALLNKWFQLHWRTPTSPTVFYRGQLANETHQWWDSCVSPGQPSQDDDLEDESAGLEFMMREKERHTLTVEVLGIVKVIRKSRAAQFSLTGLRMGHGISTPIANAISVLTEVCYT